MTNKKTKRKTTTNKLEKELAKLRIQNKQRSKSATPFGDAGSIIGQKAASIFGYPQLQGIGKWLGSGIGSIFGSGDYSMAGPRPAYNTLAGQVPKFSSTAATNIVCHREYLGDITGTSGFTNLSFPINPGMSVTFPWLATIAANYQQYRFHGLIFEFRSLITDFVTSGAPGVIVMTTNYNADQAAFTTRQEAENAEFAVAIKPVSNLVHMIECAPQETAQKLYNVRGGPVATGQDLRLYDMGLTQIITQLNPAQNIGELWVSYCVEFFKPTIALENSIANAMGLHLETTGVTSAVPMGTTVAIQSGQITATFTGTTLVMTNMIPGATYSATFNHNAATSVQPGAVALDGLTAPFGIIRTTSTIVNNTSGAAGDMTIVRFFKPTTTKTTLTLSTYTIVGACTLDVVVELLDPQIL